MGRWLLAAALAAAMLVSRDFQRERVGGTTGFMAFVAFASFAWLIVELFLRRLRTSRQKAVNIRLLVGTCLLMLGGVETFLRFSSPRLATYPERNGGRYASMYRGQRTSLLTYLPGQVIRVRRTEFDHVRNASPIGLTNPSFPQHKADNEYRIVALGDSFTEGVGTSEDTTWVRVLEARLAARYPSRQVVSLNAGISGSDPVFEYQLLKEKLLSMRPDLVVLAMNYSDVNDMMVRGGRERFQPDGSVRYRNEPAWEPLYAISYITRLFVHNVLGYDNLLAPQAAMASRVEDALRTLRATLDDLRQLCDSHGVTLLVVAHPVVAQITGGPDTTAFRGMLRDLETDQKFRFADLTKDYERDGTITKSNAGEFYWPIDRHHNERGYRVMGEAIARHVVDMRLVEGEGNGAR
jgi:lysophospholipase L1-like esterase